MTQKEREDAERAERLEGVVIEQGGEEGEDNRSNEEGKEEEEEGSVEGSGEGADEGEEKGEGKQKKKQEGEEDEGDEDEVTVTIGDEEEAEENSGDSTVIREMRKKHKDQIRKNKELEKRLKEHEDKEQEEASDEEPTFENSGLDEEVFKKKTIEWAEGKRKKKEQADAQEEEEGKAKEAWGKTLSLYGDNKAKLKVPDYDEVEEVVQSELSVNQQGMILQGAENAALIVYALGKNPKKLKELSSIKDHVKFAFAVAKLEGQLKVTPRKPKTAPEKKLSQGSASVTGSVDVSVLEKLREEADRTGDSTKVAAYRVKMREKGK